jgi:hypothetical protein
MLEASDELALAPTRNRQFLHPPLRRREKGRVAKKFAERSILTTPARVSRIVERCRG